MSFWQSLLHNLDRPTGDLRYGLIFPNLVMMPDMQPRLKWINWRWPCHEYCPGQFASHPELKLTIQWMIRDNILLQRCIFENHGEDDIDIHLEFCKSMVIRDLDHINPEYKFNKKEHADHDVRPGPGGYGWVCVHKIDAEQPVPAHETGNTIRGSQTNIQSRSCDRSQECEEVTASPVPPPTKARHNVATGSITVQEQSQESESQHKETLQDNRAPNLEQDSAADLRPEQPGKSEFDSHGHDASFKDSYGIAIICSVAINGRVKRFGNSTTRQEWKRKVEGRPPSEPRARSLEVTTAYKMEHLKTSTNHWEELVIPWRNMRVSEFLRQEQTDRSLRMCILAPSKDSIPHSMGQAGENSSVEGTRAPAGAESPEHHAGEGTERDQPQYDPICSPVGTPGKSSSPPDLGLPQDHLEFALRRNLEHILSVCSVQTTLQTQHKAAARATSNTLDNETVNTVSVALTCGDMSGHRICWSASL